MKQIIILLFLGTVYSIAAQPVLDKQAMLDRFDFWNNEDWDWYKSNIPFLETPDEEVDKTYYYRWELTTIHLIYGSPESGYASTEFIDRPWWSGSFGTISCPVGHHIYDFRWFRNPRYLKEYTTYWYKTPGAELFNYTNWLADAIWQSYKVNRDFGWIYNLHNDMQHAYYEWERRHWVEAEGMFAWDGMHDGMETNINSRQTPKWFDGAPGYRPTLNAYMWADAHAIANIARVIRNNAVEEKFLEKAAVIKTNFQQKNWDPKRNFFFHRFQNDEVTADGTDTIRANTLTYEDGKYAGSPHGRELMGYVPWYFSMPDQGFESAWQYLMDSEYFYADYGPTVVGRNDPLFRISENCCVWSGNSWPFATSQTIKALSNVINHYDQSFVSKADFLKLFEIFTLTHRKDDRPYIAEALHPDTGSWSGHDRTGHSEHYYHSSYVDLVINDLIGLKPHESDTIEVIPLVPDDWDYFCLDDIIYHGHQVSILYDGEGDRYGYGKGFKIISDGEVIAAADDVMPLKTFIGYKRREESVYKINYAVNNTGGPFPEAITSFPGIDHPASKLNDGQYWYLTPTTNQWSTVYSDAKSDWAGIDFGDTRMIDQVGLYFVSDDSLIQAPKEYRLEYWKNNNWQLIPGQERKYKAPVAKKENPISFPALSTTKIRVLLEPMPAFEAGISEIEAWGPPRLPISQSMVKGGYNKAYQADVDVSFTSRFDSKASVTDGLTNYTPRWTTFESPHDKEWIEIILQDEAAIESCYIYFYEDNNIKVPQDFVLKYRKNDTWIPVKIRKQIPDEPGGNKITILRFDAINTNRFRLELTPQQGKYVGIYELELH